MYIYAITKRRLVRIAFSCLLVLAGVGIGIYAILTAISTNAATKKLPVYRVERGDNKICLTFDAAWGNSNTDTLLATLTKENVPATFFVTGEWAEKFPEDMKKIADAGHEIQNHSNAHPHVNQLKTNELINDTKAASQKIKTIVGSTPNLYRAPYGEYNDQVITTVEGMGYRTVQWDVDSLDWKDLNPDEIIKRVVKATTSGSILLFHTDKTNTDEALPEVIRQLKEKGFEFVKASDLLYAEDYYIDSKGGQRLLTSEQPMMGSAVTELAPLSSEIAPTGGEPTETAAGDPAEMPVNAPADIPVDAPAPAEIPAVTEAPIA